MSLAPSNTEPSYRDIFCLFLAQDKYCFSHIIWAFFNIPRLPRSFQKGSDAHAMFPRWSSPKEMLEAIDVCRWTLLNLYKCFKTASSSSACLVTLQDTVKILLLSIFCRSSSLPGIENLFKNLMTRALCFRARLLQNHQDKERMLVARFQDCH